MVRNAGRAEVAARRAAALLLAGAALSGCLGAGSSSQQHASVAGARLGPPVRLADCDDWHQADVRERFDTVKEIRGFAGGPVGSPAGTGRTLPDDRAYDLFERACSPSFAKRFKLYKLYTRAAAFSRR